MNYPCGSQWRKWDLHVHTPVSLKQFYGGDTTKAWERFITNIEALPPEFKVLGINDYLFIDGYRKVLDFQNNGRLQNIDLILPVIELRLNIFGGTSGDLSRVNFHIIFSDKISPDLIQAQFINSLSTSYKLSPQNNFLETEWSALPTVESLTDLGNRIINSVPTERRNDFGSPLTEGFNNLNFNLEEIQKKLNGNHYFKGKFFTAVGKTEWASIKWNEQSIAEKKNVINNVDFVFISCETISDFQRSKLSLIDSNVNDRLLDCSDAHYFSNSKEKDRLGKCFTWIKADTTFEGLRQTLYEPDRIFIGDNPPKRASLQVNRTKFIKSVQINKLSEVECEEHWFDDLLELNTGLVAIIGNKGSGKSALADIIGLLGNSKIDQEHFSFLNQKQFCRSNERKAEKFEAKLIWHSDQIFQKSLNELIDKNQVELVRYIPQNYFEIICNEISENEEGNFDKELKKVIFSHVSSSDKLGMGSLDEILDYRTRETDDAIFQFKRDLSIINENIISLESRLVPEYKRTIQNNLNKKAQELETLERSKPEEVLLPDDQSHENLELGLNIERTLSKLEGLKNKISEINQQEDKLAIQLSKLELVKEKIENFERYYQNFQSECISELSNSGIKFEDIVQVYFSLAPILKLIANNKIQKKDFESNLDPNNNQGLIAEQDRLQDYLENLHARLDEPNRKYQTYIRQLNEWSNNKNLLVGDENTIDTYKYYEHLLEDIKTIPQKLEDLRNRREIIVRQIYQKTKKLCEAYIKLYEPVQQFIKSHPIAKEKFLLNFDVSIIQVGFKENFFDTYISHAAAGSFWGVDEGNKILGEILNKTDFNDEGGVINFISSIMEHLTQDKRTSGGEKNRIESQLRKNHTIKEIYDFIYSLDYLKPRYILKMGDKELNQLSPGEKGGLLLVFYLLVDKEDIPLIIDQPEHNLDNQTIYDLLVECVKEAKQKRQVIVVTHNPNIAVVCDAEQVICASLNKKDKNRVKYISGAIENPEINKKIVDILEGTRPAFNKRRFKYIQESIE